jgi:1-acyl-sn-glycerol-3-phosphate acyltransferase
VTGDPTPPQSKAQPPPEVQSEPESQSGSEVPLGSEVAVEPELQMAPELQMEPALAVEPLPEVQSGSESYLAEVRSTPSAKPPPVPRVSGSGPSGRDGASPRVAAEDRPLTGGEKLLYQVVAAILRLFGRLFWRVRVEGRTNVPADGPFVVAPVHRSNIDTVLMSFVTRRGMRYMAKDSLWRYRWSARLLTAAGGFPVNRETADREALRTCEAALRRGEPVVIFPEGTRRSGPVITDLFDGAAFVAIRGGVPIVPVGIGGSAGAMPKGAKWLRPVKIRIVIGPPIQPPSRQGVGSKGGRRQVHDLTAQLRTELQRLFDQAEGRSGETDAA